MIYQELTTPRRDRATRYNLLALGGLGAAARRVGAGAAVGLDVRAGGLVLLHSQQAALVLAS